MQSAGILRLRLQNVRCRDQRGHKRQSSSDGRFCWGVVNRCQLSLLPSRHLHSCPIASVLCAEIPPPSIRIKGLMRYIV